MLYVVLSGMGSESYKILNSWAELLLFVPGIEAKFSSMTIEPGNPLMTAHAAIVTIHYEG